MKFSCVTLLALASSWGASDAFLSPSFGHSRILTAVRMVGERPNEDFLEALSGGNYNPEEEEEVEGGQGGSRFKEILEMAKKEKEAEAESAFRPIMNPFLDAPAPASPANPEEMSIEEQARMFREMTQKGGGAPTKSAGADLPPPGRRVSRTDRAGKPVGRNRDADTISNTADLYFAQLKRDSSVRTYARQRGDDDEADAVFADEGIKELDGILTENPYLKEQRDKEKALIDTVPDEMIKPWMESDSYDDDEKSSTGISYKEMLKQKRQRKTGGQSAAPPQAVAPSVPVEQAQPTPPQAPVPQPVVETPPPAAQSVVQQPPANTAPPQPAASSPSPTTPSSPEDTKGKIRTLMGYMLKHRGGPGFGKGRLQGGEIVQFDNLLQEVAGLLREEAAQSGGAMGGVPLMTQPAVPQQAVASPVPPAAPVAPVDTSQMDSTIACIEGAITMYKNSPPELKSSVMATMRAALASAINTCDAIIGANDPTPMAASAQVEGTIAVIEGAVAMYRNCPPELQSSVLITLRAALRSAISTCDSLLGAPQAVAVASVAPVEPAQPPVQPAAPTVPVQAAPAVPAQGVQSAAPIVPPTDPNSKALDGIYNKLKAAGGEGSLGLRSDLTSEEASELADQIVEMRNILMEELEAGIPDPEPEAVQAGGGSADGTVSKYQKMLAKAKAEKAGK